MHTRFLLLLLAVFSTSPAARGGEEAWQIPVTLGKDGWMVYENPRFGFSLPVPPAMRTMRPPENGDGQRFASADGKVQLSAWGAFNVEHLGDVEKRWQEELAEKGRTITYKRKADGWFVVSGVNADGTGFYLRYTANSRHAAGWMMTYPQADEKKYSPWIERISKSYEARLGKGQDN